MISIESTKRVVKVMTYCLIVWERLLIVAGIYGGCLRGRLANGADNVPEKIGPAARIPDHDQQGRSGRI